MSGRKGEKRFKKEAGERESLACLDIIIPGML